MKLRNFLIVLFALLMVFAFASCKHEPTVNPTPEPEDDPWELYPYKDYTPTTNDVVVIEITEGCEKDYYNRDKLKIRWEEAVAAGDTITLKYRSERGIYQWDIRDEAASLKWVYETDKNNFTDPVLGEGGWYTLSYTFADKDINGAQVDGNDAFAIYFRGNFVEGDIFEIMDVRLNGEPLDIVQDNILSKAEVTDTIQDHVWDIPRNYAVLLATGKPGEEDKTPLVAKVAPGSTAQDLYDELEEDGGYIVSLFSDSAKTTPYNLSTKILKDALIVYYTRTGVERTVKFDLNGGTSETAIADVKLLNGQSVDKPETIPTKEGALFAEWCTDAAGTKPYDFSKAVKGDLTLYARYGAPRTVIFNLNGAEGSIADAIVPDGMTVARPTPEPVNGIYALEDWYLGTEVYDFSSPVTSNIELRAEWDNKTVVTLNLNYEGATPTTFKTVVDTPLAENDKNLTVDNRPGFFFEGWYDDKACETKHDFTANVTGPFTLYAKWRAGKIAQLTSTFNYADNTGNYDKFRVKFTDGDYAKVVAAGDVVSFRYRSTTPITKFNVRGSKKWVYQQNFATPYLTSIEEGTDGWTSVVYTFPAQGSSFDDGGGTIDYANNYTFYFDFISYTIVKGDIIEIQGMALNGVELTIDSGNIQSGTSSTKPTYKLIAEDYKWEKHTVTFNSNDGTAVPDASVAYGGKVAEPATTRDGWAFGGWYKDALFANEFNFNTPIFEDTTLYAKWLDVWTVTLDFNEGENSETKTVAVGKGDKMRAPQVGRPGYFVDWYTEAACVTKVDFADYTPAADTTLYAKWRAVETTYKFTVKDGGPTSDRYQWIWDTENLAALSSLREGDVLTFMVKNTPSTGQSITNFRLRDSEENELNLKYIDLPAADENGWISVKIVLPKGSNDGGFVLGLYAASQAEKILTGDVLELKGVAFNGEEIVGLEIDTGWSCAADMEVSKAYALTATSSGDRFQLKWAAKELAANDVVSFKFKGTSLKSYTVRSITPDAKYVNNASYTGEVGSDGWYSFTYTIPASGTGLGLSLFPATAIAEGDVLIIKDLTVNGEALALAQENNWPGVGLTIVQQ